MNSKSAGNSSAVPGKDSPRGQRHNGGDDTVPKHGTASPGVKGSKMHCRVWGRLDSGKGGTGRQSNLWGALVLLVFLIMLSAGILMTLLAFAFVRLKLIWSGYAHPNPLVIVFIVVLTCIVIGTAITAFTGRRVLGPITGLSEATKEVAKGNFNVQLPYEDHRIRELGQMAGDFNKMVQELNGIETLRSDFVVNVSHEFKTPLAAIEGYAALLQDPDITLEERREYSRLIMESTKQLSSLSSNVLKLSKLENQEIIAEREWFALDEQIRQALLLLEPGWNARQLVLDIALEPLPYYGSEEMLMQVWLNVIGNAIKFSHEGGELFVGLAVAGNSAVVTIRDNGIGMTEEVRKHIFEKFYQGDPARTGEGNGLGLPLARRIVELCGGGIAADSESGSGSVFTITLPLHAG